MKNVPPAPPGWNKTLAELYNEVKVGLRETVGQPEFTWGWDYEKSLLPSGTRFPKGGDVYEAKDDLELSYLITFQAPASGGSTGTLRKGERVVAVRNDYDPRPIVIYARPEPAEEIEKRLVPEAERTGQKFAGLLFSIKTYDLNTKFKLVSGPEGRK
jgi:hypothetical protein